MLTKPFRPPLLKRPADEQMVVSQLGLAAPPLKKRRVSAQTENQNGDVAQLDDFLAVRDAAPSIFLKRPAKSLTDPIVEQTTAACNGFCADSYYAVLWRNFKAKKHKTWDGDGILWVVNSFATLRDSDGRIMGKIKCEKPLLPDALLSISGKEVMVESVIPQAEWPSSSSRVDQGHKPTTKVLDEASRTNVKFNVNIKDEVNVNRTERNFIEISRSSVQKKHSVFKTPLKDSTARRRNDAGAPVPRHDPRIAGSLVMKRPSITPAGQQIVDVVVDPLVSQNLREHQRTGVQFLYECVMGMRPFVGDGAILADEMGLGKTLQVIALLWTLLKQNPIYGDQPVIKKALIVCPVTLIKNWKKEFRKWLGLERVGIFVFEDKRTKLTDFTMGKSYNIMIIGYEKLRTVYGDLQKGSGIDIIIADEGHRLKTAQNKCAQALKSLSTSRKIILSGTPLQNDLSEFFFMVDFVNPGLLGKASKFKKEFEIPILKSQQPGVGTKDMEKGEGRSEELANLTSLFILRRTAEILTKYLPAKTEYILFCRPTSVQASVYRSLMCSSAFPTALNSPEASLQLVGILKKLCNSPSLLRAKDGPKVDTENEAVSPLLASIPSSLLKSPGASGKLQVLDNLLYRLHTTTDEKVVIVSNYTATLDILENLLTALGYSFLRLDGSTSQSKRQDLVDRFNRADGREYFAFLLSAKSGGMGLNLTGASRLVLFDNDWNPSTDLQAMARIHRDGQRRPCRIYRLLTTGAIDEKIYQRQLTKLSLAGSIVDNKVSANSFTKEDLKDLFRLDEGEKCQTHELLACQCGELGLSTEPASSIEDDETTAETEDLRQHVDDSSSILTAPMVESGPRFIPGSNLADGGIPTETKRKRAKGKMQMALMGYRHFSTAKFIEHLATKRFISDTDAMASNCVDNECLSMQDTDVLLNDKALLDLIIDPENRVNFIFAKRSS